MLSFPEAGRHERSSATYSTSSLKANREKVSSALSQQSSRATLQTPARKSHARGSSISQKTSAIDIRKSAHAINSTEKATRSHSHPASIKSKTPPTSSDGSDNGSSCSSRRDRLTQMHSSNNPKVSVTNTGGSSDGKCDFSQGCRVSEIQQQKQSRVGPGENFISR